MSTDNVFYSHSKTNGELHVWLSSHNPTSNTKTDDGWYWIKSTPGRSSNFTEEEHEEFMQKGEKLVVKMVEKIQELTKLGPDRKKGERDTIAEMDAKKEIYNRFNRKLKELSIKTKHIAGKWFFFLPPSEVNEVWKTITRGYLNGGALVRAGSVMAKVTSSLADDYKVYCISVYCEDSFDKSKVKKLLDALINDCGLVPSSYKIDANSYLDIKAGHHSNIKTTLYSPKDFYLPSKIEAMLQNRSHAKAAHPSSEDSLDIGIASSSEDDEPPAKRRKR